MNETDAIPVFRWLTRRPAYMLLTADDDALAEESPRRFAFAWAGLMALSLAWGIGTVCLWDWSGKLFNWYWGIPLMPTAVVVTAIALWMFRRSLLALAGLLSGSSAAATLTSTVALVILVLSLLGLQRWDEDYKTYLPELLRWLHPGASYRVLILMPVWGAWAMLVTVQFCRPGERTEPAVAAFARGCGPLTTALCMGALLATTILQFNFLPWWQLFIPVAAILAAIGGGLGLSWRTGGLTRQALLAANFLTQLTFLIAYLAVR